MVFLHTPAERAPLFGDTSAMGSGVKVRPESPSDIRFLTIILQFTVQVIR